jgi:ornithine carbamoyltransferase
VGGIKMGMSVSIGCPDTYQPDKAIMAWAKENGDFTCTSGHSGRRRGR